MVEQFTPVYDRVGHVIRWGYPLELRKIYSGFRSPFDGSVMWHHMPCKENEDRAHVIKGPMFAECGGFIYYWVTEETASRCELISEEEITEEDKRQLALPAAPPCNLHMA